MQRFGIYAPQLGKRNDFPVILMNKAVTPENMNIRINEGLIETAKMRTSVVGATSTMPDGNPAIRLIKFTLANGSTEYVVAFTKLHVYYYKEASSEWDNIDPDDPDKAPGTAYEFTETDYWDVCIYGQYLCATNGQDKPIKWNGSSICTFIDTDLDATPTDIITKAKFITSYNNYLILGNVTIGATDYPEHIYWSNIGEGIDAEGFYLDIEGKDAGSAYIPGLGNITGGFGHYKGDLMIFKARSIRRLWFTGGSLVFNQDDMQVTTGCIAPGSVVNDRDGNLFFFGSDKRIREISYGSISEQVRAVTEGIDTDMAGQIASMHIDDYNELWWAVPCKSLDDNSAGIEHNNYVLCFKKGVWTIRKMQVVAFGQYIKQVTYDYLDLPHKNYTTGGVSGADVMTWDGSSWSLESAANDESYWDWGHFVMPGVNEVDPIDIVSDDSGAIYTAHYSYNDNSEEYESYFTLTTDLADKQALYAYKRLLKMSFYFDISDLNNNRPPALSVSVKKDTETSWQNISSVLQLFEIDSEIYGGWFSVGGAMRGYISGATGTVLATESSHCIVVELDDPDTPFIDGETLMTQIKGVPYVPISFANAPYDGSIVTKWIEDSKTASVLNRSYSNDIVKKELACDIRARHFLIKISSKQPFKFLGIEFGFVYAGDR